MTTQPYDVTKRLTALEKQNLRLKWAFIATWAVAIALALMGQSRETTFEVVQARKFKLVAQDGKELATLEPTDEGARLRILEPKGESSVELSTWKDASKLLMRTRGPQAQTHDFMVLTRYSNAHVRMAGANVDGEQRGSLELETDQQVAKLMARQKPSDHMIYLDVGQGVGWLTLGKENGARFSALSSQSGGSGFLVRDANGKSRLSAIWREETGAEFALYDSEGKKTASLIGDSDSALSNSFGALPHSSMQTAVPGRHIPNPDRRSPNKEQQK